MLNLISWARLYSISMHFPSLSLHFWKWFFPPHFWNDSGSHLPALPGIVIITSFSFPVAQAWEHSFPKVPVIVYYCTRNFWPWNDPRGVSLSTRISWQSTDDITLYKRIFPETQYIQLFIWSIFVLIYSIFPMICTSFSGSTVLTAKILKLCSSKLRSFSNAGRECGRALFSALKQCVRFLELLSWWTPNWG